MPALQLDFMKRSPKALSPPQWPMEVVCVKFSNLIDGVGRAGEPPASVAAVAARWVDGLQLLEIEFGNGVQLFRQPRAIEAGRQIVEPSAVFVLQIDERGDRRRPPSRPWRDAPRQRRGRCAGVPAQPGAMSRLALGWGHRYGADPTLGHALTPWGQS